LWWGLGTGSQCKFISLKRERPIHVTRTFGLPVFATYPEIITTKPHLWQEIKN